MSRKSDHRIDGFCDEGRLRLGSRRSHQEKEKRLFQGGTHDLRRRSMCAVHTYRFSFDDGARLELMTKAGKEDPDKPLNRTGYAHIAFSVGSKEKVDKLTNKLRSSGYEVVSGPRTTGDGYYESCIIAIEGHQVEITV